MRAQISDTFRLELLKRRAAGERAYQIADRGKVRRNEPSGTATGAIPVRRDDARVARVAVLLGLTLDQCFAEAESAVAP